MGIIVAPLEAVQLVKFLKGYEPTEKSKISAENPESIPCGDFGTGIWLKRRTNYGKICYHWWETFHHSTSCKQSIYRERSEPILKVQNSSWMQALPYLDVNIGPAENMAELMKWAVELLQSKFDNVPLALDTSNKAAIEAGISVYNRSKGKPIVNSAGRASGRIENIDLAAPNDISLSLCATAKELLRTTTSVWVTAMLLERHGHGLAWNPTICGSIRYSWLSRECRTSRWRSWNLSKWFPDMGLKSTGGLSNNSNGMPKHIRPIMDSALVAMAMMKVWHPQSLT